MKSEKGIAREKKKNGEKLPVHHINSKRAAELIVEAPNHNAVIERLKEIFSRRTMRRVMTYVRKMEHEKQVKYLREKDVL